MKRIRREISVSKHHDKDSLVIKYKREFEVALIKICLVAGGIGFATGQDKPKWVRQIRSRGAADMVQGCP